MNKERIKELYNIALVAAGQEKQFGTTNLDVAEQFAKLIVAECLEQIDEIRDECESDNEDQQALGADWAGLAVARHFGIE